MRPYIVFHLEADDIQVVCWRVDERTPVARSLAQITHTVCAIEIAKVMKADIYIQLQKTVL